MAICVANGLRDRFLGVLPDEHGKGVESPCAERPGTQEARRELQHAATRARRRRYAQGRPFSGEGQARLHPQPKTQRRGVADRGQRVSPAAAVRGHGGGSFPSGRRMRRCHSEVSVVIRGMGQVPSTVGAADRTLTTTSIVTRRSSLACTAAMGLAWSFSTCRWPLQGEVALWTFISFTELLDEIEKAFLRRNSPTSSGPTTLPRRTNHRRTTTPEASSPGGSASDASDAEA